MMRAAHNAGIVLNKYCVCVYYIYLFFFLFSSSAKEKTVNVCFGLYMHDACVRIEPHLIVV